MQAGVPADRDPDHRPCAYSARGQRAGERLDAGTGLAALRGGDVVGDVVPVGDGERVLRLLRATDRELRRRMDAGLEAGPGTLRRLCCDAEITPVVLDGNSVPIDVGDSHRTVTPEIAPGDTFGIRAVCVVDQLLPVKLALDLVYVREQSLAYDLSLILRTAAVILARAAGRRSFAEPSEMRRAREVYGFL